MSIFDFDSSIFHIVNKMSYWARRGFIKYRCTRFLQVFAYWSTVLSNVYYFGLCSLRMMLSGEKVSVQLSMRRLCSLYGGKNMKREEKNNTFNNDRKYIYITRFSVKVHCVSSQFRVSYSREN